MILTLIAEHKISSEQTEHSALDYTTQQWDRLYTYYSLHPDYITYYYSC